MFYEDPPRTCTEVHSEGSKTEAGDFLGGYCCVVLAGADADLKEAVTGGFGQSFSPTGVTYCYVHQR